jgi:hypothetical protein
MFDHDMTLVVEMPIELLREFPLEIYAICRETFLDFWALSSLLAHFSKHGN